ncbi:DNA starvation/stationary phase protection protein Dps [Calycomorphotria hydatis]|uniref:Fine tangled pili major subunit n=1 Tax=Calycomorphotria hydatis TaxID=2528027 RepID=A0A517TF12_9PLAN|nr:DNA starvation/stationary phase protection protein Dps [Calycomorphotria hydatis]QDT66966.1 Fine tangled pili major subunit [Calycomorphotria hydatis]
MKWKRSILDAEKTKVVCDELQTVLVHLIDLSLTSKQAHWNLFGTKFLPIHEKIDEIVAFSRDYSDEVAERMDQLGVAPDGRVGTVAKNSTLPEYPESFETVDATVTAMADRLSILSKVLRTAQETVSDADPMTEDIIIAITQTVEKELWMLQASED